MDAQKIRINIVDTNNVHISVKPLKRVKTYNLNQNEHKYTRNVWITTVAN